MIQGLDTFAQFFVGFENRYTMIGGVACHLNMAQADINFRATKDLDIVLCAEALDAEFTSRFWEFVKLGGYEHLEQSTGGKQFYRFSKPKDPKYPQMLELFSRRLDAVFLDVGAHLTPIPFDEDVSSLSAILLDDDYYSCIQDGKIIVDGIPILSVEYIIPFKMRAYLDLTLRKEQGEQVDARKIKKHRNDVLVIAQVLQSQQRVKLPDEIKLHMVEFIKSIENESIEMKNLSQLGVRFEEILTLLVEVYDLQANENLNTTLEQI